MKVYNLTINKIGRKWIQVKDEYNKQYKLLLDELTKDFEVGETYEILCELIDKSTSFGVNRELYAKDEKKVEEEKIQKEINKIIVKLNNSLKWVKENIKEYWYKNGEITVLEMIEELKKYNIETKQYEDRLQQLRNEFETIQEEIERKNYEWERKYTKLVDYEYVRYRADAEGNRDYLIGAYIENNDGTLMKIKSIDYRFIYKDDAEDIGYKYQNVVEFVAILKDISEEEKIVALQKIKEKEEEKRLEKEAAEFIKNNLNQLKDYILKNGKTPELREMIEGEIIVNQKYGSIIKKDNEIWLLIYNWGDGDDWSKNNIAGTHIGKVVEYKEVAPLIDVIK